MLERFLIKILGENITQILLVMFAISTGIALFLLMIKVVAMG